MIGQAGHVTIICCSLCGKSQKQVKKIIAGHLRSGYVVYICNECIDMCHAVVHHDDDKMTDDVLDITRQVAREQKEGLS